MFFGKKKEQKIADQITNQSYWFLVRKQFKENRIAVWALRFLCFLIFIALTGDFIANEKPIYCKLDGETHFPVFQKYLVDLGIAKWDAKFIQSEWSDHDYESVIYPLIPYSAKTLDFKNTKVSPFEDQQVDSGRFHHWLGTDQYGRDISAGMIQGTRVALMVGIISMGIATFIGLFFGGIAGFFGDDQIYISRAQLVFNTLGLILGIFYGFTSRAFFITEYGFITGVLEGIFIFIIIMILANLIAKGFDRLLPPKKKIALAIDLIVMRIIEVVNSIPALIIVLAILAAIEKESIINIIVLIGLLSWTGIARFVRAELLRVRALDYVEAARSLGLSNFRILIKHALPNALTPVLISIAFGVAGAILAEATLSFLGIGIPTEEITWGKILNYSRDYSSAWWLAIFPGFAIFITVMIFNLLGEGLTDAINPRLRQ